MDCMHCGSTDTAIFFVEKIPCSHCDEITNLIYETCNDCNLMWKSVDGEVLNNSFDSMEEIDSPLDFDMELPTEEELDEMIREFESIIEATEMSEATTMQDMIHRCLRCETVSYEVKPRHYHCPDCGFEWEVL